MGLEEGVRSVTCLKLRSGCVRTALLGEGWWETAPELPCDAAGTEGSGAEEGDKGARAVVGGWVELWVWPAGPRSASGGQEANCTRTILLIFKNVFLCSSESSGIMNIMSINAIMVL